MTPLTHHPDTTISDSKLGPQYWPRRPQYCSPQYWPRCASLSSIELHTILKLSRQGVLATSLSAVSLSIMSQNCVRSTTPYNAWAGQSRLESAGHRAWGFASVSRTLARPLSDPRFWHTRRIFNDIFNDYNFMSQPPDFIKFYARSSYP